MIPEQCTYVCGAYEGYYGKAEYDVEDDLFHGEVIGVRDVVTFQGRTPGELRRAFRESVDDYLAFCAQRNESPEKPYSGKFLARIHPDVHRKLSLMAGATGKSMNQFVADCLTRIADALPSARAPLARTVKPAKAADATGPKPRRKSRGKDGQRA